MPLCAGAFSKAPADNGTRQPHPTCDSSVPRDPRGLLGRLSDAEIQGTRRICGSVKMSLSSLEVLENSETMHPSGPAWNQ